MISAHTFFEIITDIGDSACLLGIVAACSIYLLYRRSKRAAVFLIATFGLSSLFIALLKLSFFNCHNQVHYAGVHSPSGHAANSAAVLLAIAVLMRSQLEQWRRFVPLLILSLCVAAIAISRVWLGLHTIPEIIIGLLAGAAALLLTRFFILRGKGIIPFDAYVLMLWAIIAAFALHGMQLPAEEWLHGISVHLRGHIPFCA